MLTGSDKTDIPAEREIKRIKKASTKLEKLKSRAPLVMEFEFDDKKREFKKPTPMSRAIRRATALLHQRSGGTSRGTARRTRLRELNEGLHFGYSRNQILDTVQKCR